MSKHRFFIGAGSSGGGGSGSYAYIMVQYPAGQIIECEFEGDTTEAPDTSGIWSYGCSKAGTYIFRIQGTTTSQTVEITTQGQIEIIWVTPQVINYALIYYLGNEFSEPTEEEKKYAIKTGGWEMSVKRYTSASSYNYFRAFANTKVNIDTNDYQYSIIYGKYQTTFVVSYRNISYGQGINSQTEDNKEASIINNLFMTRSMHFASSNGTLTSMQAFDLNSISTKQNNLICIDLYSTSSSSGDRSESNKQSNYLHLSNPVFNNQSSVSRAQIYMVGFVKTDDISGLSNYGSTISEILSNGSSLFDDTIALNWMVLNCTGDFMISALSNSNFINNMNASPNKTILTANEHWARFIALLSV